MAATLRCEIFPADLDATVSFYVSVLGFHLVRDERDQSSAYVALRRTRSIWVPQPGPRFPIPASAWRVTGVELVLEVDDLDQDYARVAAARWPLAEDLTDRPWGLRDFRLLDRERLLLAYHNPGRVSLRQCPAGTFDATGGSSVPAHRRPRPAGSSLAEAGDNTRPVRGY